MNEEPQRYCEDCAWFLPVPGIGVYAGKPDPSPEAMRSARCKHPMTKRYGDAAGMVWRDPPLDMLPRAQQMRTVGKPCGLQGDLWERKEDA